MCSRTKEPHRVTYSIWHVSLVQWKGLRDQGTAETLVSTFMFILRCADLGMCVILGLSRVLACIDNDMKVTQINIKGKHKKRQLQRNRISTRKSSLGISQINRGRRKSRWSNMWQKRKTTTLGQGIFRDTRKCTKQRCWPLSRWRSACYACSSLSIFLRTNERGWVCGMLDGG
jgi:hypothetical protein